MIGRTRQLTHLLTFDLYLGQALVGVVGYSLRPEFAVPPLGGGSCWLTVRLYVDTGGMGASKTH